MVAEHEEWHPPVAERYPTEAQSFPATGVNSLAPIWVRAVARLIDSLIVAVPTFLVFAVAALVSVGTDAEAAAQDRGLQIWVTGAAFVSAVIYETVGVTLWGQTLGKLIVGIRVARQANGRNPQWWEAAIRVALPGVVTAVPHPAASAAVLVLYGLAVFDPMRRSGPDRAAGTVVVRAR